MPKTNSKPAPTSLTDEECLYRVHKELCIDYPSIQRKRLFRCWFCVAEHDAYQRGRDDAFNKIEQKINTARYDTNINGMEYFRNLIKEARRE
jgi:hypothetical protein